MKIISWNVNGIRAVHRKGFESWLAGSGADLVAVQEVRASAEQVPEPLRASPTWRSHFVTAKRPGYSGVGLFTRERPNEVVSSLGVRDFDVEARVQMARFGKLWIVNGYFPNGNGKNRDLSRIPFKLRFYRRLFLELELKKARNEPVLVVGDFNTAHQDIDLARPRENRENSGFRPEERRELDRWIRAGWVDTFRHFQKGGGHYTWWSQRVGVRERNIGWRLDYILASPAAMEWVHSARIHPEVKGSDHCPVSVEIDARAA